MNAAERIKFLRKNLKKITLITSCLVFLFCHYLLAADTVANTKPEDISSLSEQARQYRVEGVKFQEEGNLDAALEMYQKAATLDSSYQVVFNDLGIIYEAKGETDRAEESYLKALKIDPSFLDAYTNLAFLYENKRDLEKAVYYWKKRVELGDPDDPWTLKAQQRLDDVRLSMSRDPALEFRQREAADLVREVSESKNAAEKIKAKQAESQNAEEKVYSQDMDEAQETLNRDTTQNKSYNF